MAILKGHFLQNIVSIGFGGSVIATAIAINGIPDYIYSGSMIFLVSMYITGIKLASKSSVRAVFQAQYPR